MKSDTSKKEAEDIVDGGHKPDAAGKAEASGTADESMAEPSRDKEKSPEELIQALIGENEMLRKEVENFKDQLLRLAAEMENLRRRTERDVKDARQFSISGFARDLLSVGDNLERALCSVSDEDRAAGHKGLNALLEGVEMTSRELTQVMAKHGVVKEWPEGQKFDPNRHQAMFEVPNEQAPSGTVMQVVQAGYRIGDRILRPAMVGVSSGGGKPAHQDGPANEKEAQEAASKPKP